MVTLIGAYRDILLRSNWPDSLPLAVLAAASAGLLGLGYRLYARASGSFVEVL
jgi:ABC-type polysaccharide/polyol phosphate export permease